MKILYMGTAAYDAIPAPFCTCAVCRAAFRLGGKELRTRAQALVNDDLLLDFGPDTVTHFLRYGIDSTSITSCLITHSHSDHLCADDIVIPQYSSSSQSVDYFSARSGCDMIESAIVACGPSPVRNYVHVHEVAPGMSFTTNGYHVLVLPANHDPASTPVFYAIEKDGKRLLYALDSGLFPEQVFTLLQGYGVFDLITFDCTGALDPTNEWRGGHMKLDRNREMLDRLRAIGVADDHTQVVITHFSHNGRSLHRDLEKAAAPYGITVAYDGLEIEF